MDEVEQLYKKIEKYEEDIKIKNDVIKILKNSNKGYQDVLEYLEKVDEVREENENLHERFEAQARYIEKQRDRIEKLEKALTEIKNGSTKGDYYTGWSYDIANKALGDVQPRS